MPTTAAADVLTSPASTRHSSGSGVITAGHAVTLLAGCASARRASELHAAAVRAAVDRDKAVDFRLQGRLDLAVALLRRTPDPTAVFYTSAIHAHSSRGLHHATLALLWEMLLSPHGLLPTAHTLSASVPACGGGGGGLAVGVGRALHGYAVKLAFSGEPYVATALLGRYARAGDAAAARALFDRMLPGPHVVSVTAMLPWYAKMGLLHDAHTLFDVLPAKDLICWNAMMRASGIQKEPGCSGVEVGRQVVEFVAGDRSHPRAAEIYAKLEGVNGMARARGHVPRTELVLHDLDNDDGDDLSEVTGRKIVFRDRNGRRVMHLWRLLVNGDAMHAG